MSKNYIQLKKVKTYDDFIDTITNEIVTNDFNHFGEFMKYLCDSLDKIKDVEDIEVQNKILKCAKYIDKKCYDENLSRHVHSSYILTSGYIYSQYYNQVKDKSFDNILLLSSILNFRYDELSAYKKICYFDDSILDRVNSKDLRLFEKVELMDLVNLDIPEKDDFDKESISNFVSQENNLLDTNSNKDLLELSRERMSKFFSKIHY